MANKRQERAKKRYTELRALGVPPKEAAKARYVSDKKYKARKRQARGKQRYNELRELGVPAKEAAKKRYVTPQNYESIVTKAREEKRKNERIMTIYYIDRADMVDVKTDPQAIKAAHSGESIPYLIAHIIGASMMDIGAIGAYEIILSKRSEVEGLNLFFHDAAVIYQGKASPQQYKRLLVAIATMMDLLYGSFEKQKFIYDVITNVMELNRKTGQRLAADLNIEYRGF